MRVSFVWWNTSLSPAGKDRSTKEKKSQAMSIINIFIQNLNVDVIALGEVIHSDIALIRNECQIHGYEIFNGYTKAGKAYFDTCVLYKSEKLKLINSADITAGKGGRTYRIAQRLNFLMPDGIPLYLFISHWPSRLFLQQNHADRDFLGLKLRAPIDELIELYKGDATLVLLGDYNDEPFDRSLSEHLMATRDRSLVKKKSHLLYNPFWRKLGHELPYASDSEGVPYDAGTYFYKQDPSSRWRTFDQIIFSSNFLGASEWHLNEKLTKVLDIPVYRELVLDPKETFDHFPVMGVIEKVA